MKYKIRIQVLAGGFIHERWLGQEEPSFEALENRSLVKYKMIIDDFGGWTLFQDLLIVLQRIAKRHSETSKPTTLSQIAIAYVGYLNLYCS